MLAVLEWSDLFWILVINLIVACSAVAYFGPTVDARRRRIEAKLDTILRHLGVEFQDPAAAGLSAEVRALADDPAKKIAAIALYREQTGAGLKEAKDAVEAYIAGR